MLRRSCTAKKDNAVFFLLLCVGFETHVINVNYFFLPATIIFTAFIKGHFH